MHQRFRKELESIVPVNLLINGSTFRPRSLVTHGYSADGLMSLRICPLHELFDMYRTHEATEVHDKIFALLGMCSDFSAILSAGFSFDYIITWEELASRLTKLWMGPSVTMKVLNDGRKLDLES